MDRYIEYENEKYPVNIVPEDKAQLVPGQGYDVGGEGFIYLGDTASYEIECIDGTCYLDSSDGNLKTEGTGLSIQTDDSFLDEMEQMSPEDTQERKIQANLQRAREKGEFTPAEGRAKCDQIIRYDVDPAEDSQMVVALKEAINESRITLEFLYDRAGKSDGYNMFYGLKKRKTITFQSFARWAEILELDYRVELVPKV